jgi:hypothetical protein
MLAVIQFRNSYYFDLLPKALSNRLDINRGQIIQGLALEN